MTSVPRLICGYERALSVQAASWLVEGCLHDWSQRTTEQQIIPESSTPLIGLVPKRRTVLKHAAHPQFYDQICMQLAKALATKLSDWQDLQAPKPRSCTGDIHLGCALANGVILTGLACSPQCNPSYVPFCYWVRQV